MLPDHPGQALTRLEGAPDSYQYSGVDREVTVHRMTSHFISLHIISSRGSRGRETAREEILVQ